MKPNFTSALEPSSSNMNVVKVLGMQVNILQIKGAMKCFLILCGKTHKGWQGGSWCRINHFPTPVAGLWGHLNGCLLDQGKEREFWAACPAHTEGVINCLLLPSFSKLVFLKDFIEAIIFYFSTCKRIHGKSWNVCAVQLLLMIFMEFKPVQKIIDL